MRGLHAPALYSWFCWWATATAQPRGSEVDALAKWPVPWPAQLKLSRPEAGDSEPVQIQIDDITPVRVL
ncbi:hypothetical protein ACIBUY_03885 [Streptomyces sp. NPDC050085]|uniref:hypothetical protein n=1 Tax=Streptomyces sp. NPDC050085 TaxID=3365600 RepID=UPI00379F2E8A